MVEIPDGGSSDVDGCLGKTLLALWCAEHHKYLLQTEGKRASIVRVYAFTIFYVSIDI